MEVKKLIEFNPSTPRDRYSDFRFGNSKFSDNIWDFNGYVDSRHLSGARLMIKFDEFVDRPDMLEVIKIYIANELLIKKFTTVKRNYDGLKRFVKFLNAYYPSVDSFVEIDRILLTDYFQYLLTATNETTKKPLNRTGITKSALVIKEILTLGAVRRWEVPFEVNFVHQLYDEMIINNPKLNKMEKKNQKKAQDKILDQVVINKILTTAIEDLEKKENVLTAAAIIITSQIGLRLSELVSLEEGCLNTIDGDKMLIYSTSKLNKETIKVSKPANPLVTKAINVLTEFTKERRKESGLPYLFLSVDRNTKGYPPILMNHSNYNKNFLRPWIKKHNIIDKTGKLVDFTSHTFRHAFATYALRDGVSLEVISSLMNHKSIRGTQHYTHLIEEDVKNRFAEVLNEGAIISGKRALKIKDKLKENNPFKGKTTDQVDKLRRAMKIQVLSHGMCLHHPMRNEPCAGDGVCLGCNNFITTPDFLEVHKGRLERVQAELANAETGGPFESKLRHIESYLINIIKDLESQMKDAN